jgi:hypothetical protein
MPTFTLFMEATISSSLKYYEISSHICLRTGHQFSTEVKCITSSFHCFFYGNAADYNFLSVVSSFTTHFVTVFPAVSELSSTKTSTA